MARKKKRKYRRRANATTKASKRKKRKARGTKKGTKRGPYKKRKKARAARATAPRAATRRRRTVAVEQEALGADEALAAALEDVNAQIKARTDELIAEAAGTEAASAFDALTEAANNAKNDAMLNNLFKVKASVEQSIAVLANLEDRPKRGRKAKAEAEATEAEAETEDADDEDDEEETAEADEAPKKKSRKDKVVNIKNGKKKGKAAKAASTLKKKDKEAAEG